MRSEVTMPGGNVRTALCSASVSDVTTSGGNVGLPSARFELQGELDVHSKRVYVGQAPPV